MRIPYRNPPLAHPLSLSFSCEEEEVWQEERMACGKSEGAAFPTGASRVGPCEREQPEPGCESEESPGVC